MTYLIIVLEFFFAVGAATPMRLQDRGPGEQAGERSQSESDKARHHLRGAQAMPKHPK